MTRALSRATWLRLALLLIASMLLHLALFGVLPRLPRWHQSPDLPIIAVIETAPAPVPPDAPKPVAAALPRPRIERRVIAIEPEPSPRASSPVLPVLPRDAQGEADAPTSGDQANAAASQSTPAPSPAAAPSELPVPPAPPAVKPVDARLAYRVTALDPGKPGEMLVGDGTLRFQSDAAHYRMSLEAELIFIWLTKSALSASSEGTVGPDGLEPTRYSETLINKAPWSNTFARAPSGASEVSFSKGGDLAHAVPGTQDRLTVLLQAGALMQANPALKASGSHFALPVASDKNAIDTWNFTNQGDELVRYDTGTRHAWHIARTIRPGSNDRGLELWIGTEAPFLPLRILFTEPGGKTIDLLLSSDLSHPED